MNFKVGKRYLVKTNLTDKVVYELKILEFSSDKKYMKAKFCSGSISWIEPTAYKIIEKLKDLKV